MKKRYANPQVNLCRCARCQSRVEYPEKRLHHRLNLILSRLNEQQRRWLAGWVAEFIGHGGTGLVACITGLSEKTIRRGRHELENDLQGRPRDYVRLPGGGRPCKDKNR